MRAKLGILEPKARKKLILRYHKTESRLRDLEKDSPEIKLHYAWLYEIRELLELDETVKRS